MGIRIDQLTPSLAARDAIGRHTLALRELLRSEGFASDIYYGNASPELIGEGMPIARLPASESPDRILLYHLSIGNPVGDVFATRPERKFVDYHNITPGDLLVPWEPVLAEESRWGRRQMAALAPVTELAVADSSYNAGELDAAGYRATAVAPILLDLDEFGGAADRDTAARLAAARADGGADLLFVGKVVPHKAQHDLIMALAAYRRIYDPRARLHIVGAVVSATYQDSLEQYAASLGLADAVDFSGSVSHETLVAYYRAADVFLCASDHEGFCVPLLEAMFHRVPVVAHATGAVPETLGRAGILLDSKSPVAMAAAIDRVVGDDSLRAVLRTGAETRVRELALEHSRRRFLTVLTEAVESAAP